MKASALAGPRRLRRAGPAARELMGAVLAPARRLIAARTARPHLAGTALPLAMVASLLAQPLFAPALVAAMWWWAPRGPWGFLNCLGRGLVGTEWALAGAYALQAFPGQRLLVWVCWAATAALLGLCSWLLARRG